MLGRIHTSILLLLLGLSLAPGCAGAPPSVAFMSDFGLTDDSVAVCKGEMMRVEPAVRVIDITHQVEPYDVAQAARYLAGSIRHFRRGTTVVCVVDPGVGSTRRPIAVRTRSGHYFVGPDNGLVTLLDDVAEARAIANSAWMRGQGHSSTFHGRDIFAPVAAHLARGDRFEQVGPTVPIESLARLDLARASIDAQGLRGEVIGLDGPYGNLVTNIPADLFARLGYRLGDPVSVTLGEAKDQATMTLPFVRTFSDVPEGKPLLYVDSRGRLAAAINMGDFAKTFKVGPGTKVKAPAKGGGKG